MAATLIPAKRNVRTDFLANENIVYFDQTFLTEINTSGVLITYTKLLSVNFTPLTDPRAVYSFHLNNESMETCSPYSINKKSRRQVMKVKKMINNEECLDATSTILSVRSIETVWRRMRPDSTSGLKGRLNARYSPRMDQVSAI